MDTARILLIPVLLALAGCAASPPPETAEQAAARRAISCTEAGLTKDSEAWRLCLLIQQQNDRLNVVEDRLRTIELQTIGGPYPFPSRWGWY
jgi:hypothetical protein